MSNVIDFAEYRRNRLGLVSDASHPAETSDGPIVTARIETRGGYMSAEIDVSPFLAQLSNYALRALIKHDSWMVADLLRWARENYEPVQSILDYVEFAADTEHAVTCDTRVSERELLAWLATYRPALVSCLVASNK